MSDTKFTPEPWRHVELVNEDGSSLTPEDAAEYSANTAKHGTTGFYAVQATKEDGKLYNVCFAGNGPDSIYNGAHIVKCVNLHDELVEALRACLKEMEDCLVWIEAETGLGETLEEIERDGGLTPNVLNTRQLLAKIDAYDGDGV